MSLPTTEEIIDDISFFDDWEEKYKYIIDLGKRKKNKHLDSSWVSP